LLRDLFIRNGFQLDYNYDWIAKDKTSEEGKEEIDWVILKQEQEKQMKENKENLKDMKEKEEKGVSA